MNWSRHNTGRAGSFKSVIDYASKDEKIGHVEFLNLAANKPSQAAKEMQATADAARSIQMRERQVEGKRTSHSGGAAKSPVYHLAFSWHPDDRPTRQHMIEQVQEALKRLNLQDHQAAIFHHVDRPHPHAHVVVNLIHPDTGKAATVVGNDKRLNQWAHEYEAKRQIRSPKRAAKMEPNRNREADEIKKAFAKKEERINQRHEQAGEQRRKQRDDLWDKYQDKKAAIRETYDSEMARVWGRNKDQPRPELRPKHGWGLPKKPEWMDLAKAVRGDIANPRVLFAAFPAERKQAPAPAPAPSLTPSFHPTPNGTIQQGNRKQQTAYHRAVRDEAIAVASAEFKKASADMKKEHAKEADAEKAEVRAFRKERGKAWAAWRQTHGLKEDPKFKTVDISPADLKAEQAKNAARGCARDAFNAKPDASVAFQRSAAIDDKPMTAKAPGGFERSAPIADEPVVDKPTDTRRSMYRVDISPYEAQRQFGEFIRETMVLRGPPIMDGEWHNIPLKGQRSGRSGGYRGFADGYITGQVRNNKTDQTVDWNPKGDHVPLSPAGAAKLEALAQERRRATAEKLKTQQDKAAQTAKRVVENARPADPNHPYLVRKGIQPHGILQKGSTLIVPMQNLKGEVRAFQRIYEDGSKKYQWQAERDGLFFVMGKKNDGPVRVVEGFATGASVREATGDQVAVAFDKSNLKHVARAIREKTDREIIINGDNDVHLEHKPVGNVGRKAAEEIAREINAAVRLPPKGDWNDYHKTNGIVALRGVLSEPIDRGPVIGHNL